MVGAHPVNIKAAVSASGAILFISCPYLVGHGICECPPCAGITQDQVRRSETRKSLPLSLVSPNSRVETILSEKSAS